jgi:hypothetical protein
MPDLAQHLFGLTVDFFKQHLLRAHIGNVLVCVRLASLELSSVGKHRPPPLDFGCGLAALRPGVETSLNPNSEVEKGESTNKRAGARRLRRFTIRKVLDTRKSSAWWTLKRPEGRAPLAVHHSTSVFGLNTYDGNIIAIRLRRGLSCPGV